MLSNFFKLWITLHVSVAWEILSLHRAGTELCMLYTEDLLKQSKPWGDHWAVLSNYSILHLSELLNIWQYWASWTSGTDLQMSSQKTTLLLRWRRFSQSMLSSWGNCRRPTGGLQLFMIDDTVLSAQTLSNLLVNKCIVQQHGFDDFSAVVHTTHHILDSLCKIFSEQIR